MFNPSTGDGHLEGVAFQRHQDPSAGGVTLEGAALQHHRLYVDRHDMSRRAGRTRRLSIMSPSTSHRAFLIELTNAREPGGRGTEGSAAGIEGPAASPCPKSPLEGGRTGWEYVRMVTFF